MKKSDDAAADVEGSGVVFANADGDVEACGVADDDADADACGDGEFHVITAGADDVDSCGDAAVGWCGEAISDSTWLLSSINS